MHATSEEFTLTVSEAAALLGGTEKAIQRLIFTARLDAIRVKGKRGHEFRIRPDDILTRKAELLERVSDVTPDVPAATPDVVANAAATPPQTVDPSAPPASPAVAEPAPSPAAMANADAFLSVYRELFWRYDELGRRAAQLEYENHHLRERVDELREQSGVSEPGPCTPVVETTSSPSSRPFWRVVVQRLRRGENSSAGRRARCD